MPSSASSAVILGSLNELLRLAAYLGVSAASHGRRGFPFRDACTALNRLTGELGYRMCVGGVVRLPAYSALEAIAESLGEIVSSSVGCRGGSPRVSPCVDRQWLLRAPLLYHLSSIYLAALSFRKSMLYAVLSVLAAELSEKLGVLFSGERVAALLPGGLVESVKLWYRWLSEGGIEKCGTYAGGSSRFGKLCSVVERLVEHYNELRRNMASARLRASLGEVKAIVKILRDDIIEALRWEARERSNGNTARLERENASVLSVEVSGILVKLNLNYLRRMARYTGRALAIVARSARLLGGYPVRGILHYAEMLPMPLLVGHVRILRQRESELAEYAIATALAYSDNCLILPGYRALENPLRRKEGDRSRLCTRGVVEFDFACCRREEGSSRILVVEAKSTFTEKYVEDLACKLALAYSNAMNGEWRDYCGVPSKVELLIVYERIENKLHGRVGEIAENIRERAEEILASNGYNYSTDALSVRISDIRDILARACNDKVLEQHGICSRVKRLQSKSQHRGRGNS